MCDQKPGKKAVETREPKVGGMKKKKTKNGREFREQQAPYKCERQ